METDSTTALATGVRISVPVIAADHPTASAYSGPRRYQVRFPSTDAFYAAQATEAPSTFRTAVANSKRANLAVEVPTAVGGVVSALKNEATTLEYFSHEYGAAIIEDRETAVPLGHGRTCEGWGMIDCRAALDRL